MSANSADGGNLFTALNHLIHNSTPRLLTVQRGEDYFYIDWTAWYLKLKLHHIC